MKDYKNSPAGQQNASEYADIIGMKRPEPIHPRMDLVQRAKIFAPYDALRGYDEAIAEVDEAAREVKRPVLSEEKLAVLSDKLVQVKKEMEITVTYFQPGTSPDQGQVRKCSGIAERLDPVGRKLYLSQKKPADSGKIEKDLPDVIRFDDLLDVSSPDIADVDLFLDEEDYFGNTSNQSGCE